MLKKILMTCILYTLISTYHSFAQSGSFKISPTTKSITNWSTRHTFSSFMFYDYDLAEVISGPHYTKCTVVIEINSDGKGSLTQAYNRGYSEGIMQVEKFKHDIVKCVRYDNYYKFTAATLIGIEYELILFFVNNTITQYEHHAPNNSGIIFK